MQGCLPFSFAGKDSMSWAELIHQASGTEHVIDYFGGDGALLCASLWCNVRIEVLCLNQLHKEFLMKTAGRHVIEFMKTPDWICFTDFGGEEFAEQVKKASHQSLNRLKKAMMIQVPVMTIDSSRHQFPNPKIGWSGFGGPFHAASGPCRVKSKTIVVELCVGGSS